MESCVRSFHVYKELWTPYVEENLQCVRKSGNRDDPFAVAVVRFDSYAMPSP